MNNKFQKYSLVEKPVHLVYVYEMRQQNACYIGRTKELARRHASHCRCRKHSNGTIICDVLYQFCHANNIPIPTPIVLEDNLTGIESLAQEDFWVEKYRHDGWNVLNKAKTGVKSGSLGHVQFWTYDTCREECLKYKTIANLRKHSMGCYDVCYRNGWLKDLIPKEGKHPNGFWKNKNNVLNEAKKYKTITDFIRNAIGAYKSAKTNGWLSELSFHENSQNKKWDVDKVWEFYKKSGSIRETIKNFQIDYRTIKRLFQENGYAIGNHNRKDPEPRQYIEIQQLLNEGVSMREIERRYNICRKRIPKIFDLTSYHEHNKKTK